MIAVIRFAYLWTPGIWQVGFELPLDGVRALSTQVAATGIQARAQTASDLSARGFHVLKS
jgi:hypothetical protein